MTTQLNIGGDPTDQYYRYKRDKIKVLYLTKNSGTTSILNMPNICTQLKVPDAFCDAFYKKVKKTGKSMIKPGVFKGTIDVLEFETILETMIKKYIICSNCELPELVGNTCNACGHSS
jgi:translation initiation factor 2 beta subunit (eIF-2beta)/eIF-5